MDEWEEKLIQVMDDLRPKIKARKLLIQNWECNEDRAGLTLCVSCLRVQALDREDEK